MADSTPIQAQVKETCYKVEPLRDSLVGIYYIQYEAIQNFNQIRLTHIASKLGLQQRLGHFGTQCNPSAIPLSNDGTL